MSLFRIEMVAAKFFFVEAESHGDALEMAIVGDEADFSFSNKSQWEHMETTAKEISEKQSHQIRQRRSKEILSDE